MNSVDVFRMLNFLLPILSVTNSRRVETTTWTAKLHYKLMFGIFMVVTLVLSGYSIFGQSMICDASHHTNMKREVDSWCLGNTPFTTTK